jgi:hypothetical protein
MHPRKYISYPRAKHVDGHSRGHLGATLSLFHREFWSEPMDTTPSKKKKISLPVLNLNFWRYG